MNTDPIILVGVDPAAPLDLSEVPMWARRPAPAVPARARRIAERLSRPDVSRRFTGVPSPLRARNVAHLASRIGEVNPAELCPSRADLRAAVELLTAEVRADGTRTRAALGGDGHLAETIVSAVRDEGRATRSALQGASNAEPAPEAGPIHGYRAAANVLGVGRERVRKVVGGLPEHRKPAMVPARGGRPAIWFESAHACTEWWIEVHSTPARAPRKRKSSTSVRPRDTRSLRERLSDL